MLDVCRRFGVLEEAAKVLVAKLPRYILKGSQVIARAVVRRHQQEEQVDLVAVETVEVDSLSRNAERSYRSRDAGVLGVGNGNPPANTGAAEFFPLEDGFYDPFRLLGAQGA